MLIYTKYIRKEKLAWKLLILTPQQEKMLALVVRIFLHLRIPAMTVAVPLGVLVSLYMKSLASTFINPWEGETPLMVYFYAIIVLF